MRAHREKSPRGNAGVGGGGCWLGLRRAGGAERPQGWCRTFLGLLLYWGNIPALVLLLHGGSISSLVFASQQQPHLDFALAPQEHPHLNLIFVLGEHPSFDFAFAPGDCPWHSFSFAPGDPPHLGFALAPQEHPTTRAKPSKDLTPVLHPLRTNLSTSSAGPLFARIAWRCQREKKKNFF